MTLVRLALLLIISLGLSINSLADEGQDPIITQWQGLLVYGEPAENRSVRVDQHIYDFFEQMRLDAFSSGNNPQLRSDMRSFYEALRKRLTTGAPDERDTRYNSENWRSNGYRIGYSYYGSNSRSYNEPSKDIRDAVKSDWPYVRTGNFFGLLLPSSQFFSNGNQGLPKEDVEKIVSEFVSGSKNHLNSLGLEIGDLLLILSAVNITPYLKQSPDYLASIEHFETLQEQDGLEVRLGETAMVSFLTAFENFKEALEKPENAHNQDLLPIGRYLFSRALFQGFKQYFSIKQENDYSLTVELIREDKSGIQSVNLSLDPIEARSQISEIVSSGQLLVRPETYQNMKLAIEKTKGLADDKIAELDRLMDVLITAELAESLGIINEEDRQALAFTRYDLGSLEGRPRREADAEISRLRLAAKDWSWNGFSLLGGFIMGGGVFVSAFTGMIDLASSASLLKDIIPYTGGIAALGAVLKFLPPFMYNKLADSITERELTEEEKTAIGATVEIIEGLTKRSEPLVNLSRTLERTLRPQAICADYFQY